MGLESLSSVPEPSSLVSKTVERDAVSTPLPQLIYQPLDAGDFEIRILTLLPDGPGAPIRCKLENVSLVRPGTYTSLSYCWGNPSPSAEVYINDCMVPVGLNLNHALRDLRSLGIKRVWADALCINQADRQERSLQVRLMRQIYSKAARVISWIGQSTEMVATAMDIMKKYEKKSDQRHFIEKYGNENTFNAFEAFFQRPYWKRVWIIQEIAVARSVTILCGANEISWPEVANVELLLRFLTERPYLMPSYAILKGVVKLCETYRQSISCDSSLGERIPKIEPINLCHAISSTRNALATDPRDKIYALIGISQDGETLVPIPNYIQPFEETLRDLTLAIMRRHATLDLLLWKTSQKTRHNKAIPSWVLQLSDIPYDAVAFLNSRDRGIETSLDKLNAEGDDAALKMPGIILSSIKSMTSAAGSAVANIPVLAGRQDHKMETDLTTKYYGDRHLVGKVLWELLSLEKYSSDSSIKVYTALFSELWVGPGQMHIPYEEHQYHSGLSLDTGPPSLNRKLGVLREEQGYRSTFLYRKSGHCKDVEAWFEHNATFMIGDKTLQELTGRTSIWTSLTTFKRSASRLNAQAELLKAVSGSIRTGLQLFVTEKGALGIANPETLVGDKVCFSTACSEPLILREVEYQGRTAYKLIGSAHMCLSTDDEGIINDITSANILELV